MAAAPVEPAPVRHASVRQVTVNGLWLLLAYVVPRLTHWVAILIAARLVGAERFGWYGTAASLAVIASVGTTLGMMPLLIRDLAREPHRASAVLRAAHRLKTGTNLAMLAGLAGVAWLLDYPGPVAVAAILLGLAYAIGSYAENLGAYLQATERMHVWMQANAALGIVAGGTGIVLVLTTGSIVAFCGAMVLGQSAALAWLVRQARVPSSGERNVRVPDLVRGVAPFAMAFVLLTIFYKVDVLIVHGLRGSRAVGLYTAAYKFIDVLHALTLVGIGAVYPRLSRLLHGQGTRGPQTGARLLELSTLGTVIAAGVLSLGAPTIIALTFGAEYGPSAHALSVLALAVPFLAINLLAGYLLGARDRMSWVAAAYGVGLLVKVYADVVGIGRWGVVGAAGAMVIAEMTIAVLLIGTLIVREGIRPRLRAVVAPAGALLVAVGLLLAGVRGPGTAAAFALTVLVVYRFVGALTSAEHTLLRQLLAARFGSVIGEASPEVTR